MPLDLLLGANCDRRICKPKPLPARLPRTQLSFDSEGVALTSTMGFIKNPVGAQTTLFGMRKVWGGAVYTTRGMGLESDLRMTPVTHTRAL